MLIKAHEVTLALDGVSVLSGIDLNVHPGDIYGLLGPNGAGKSTTISVLTGLRTAASGDLTVLGLHPANHGAELRRQIGVLPEKAGFYDWMNAADYLHWFARLYNRQLTANEVARQLGQVGLDAANRQSIGTYSLGMKQRLGLARALFNHPRLLILDEPTNGLDPRGRREIHDILRDLSQRQGVGILLCTHLLDDVDRLCNRIGIIHHGQTVIEGALSELLADRKTAARYRLRLLSPPPDRNTPPGVQVVGNEGGWWHVEMAADRQPDRVWNSLLKAGWPVVEIHHEGGGLEDLYLRTTEKEKAA